MRLVRGQGRRRKVLSRVRREADQVRVLRRVRRGDERRCEVLRRVRDEGLTQTYACRLDGEPAEATIGATELVVNGRPFPYVDLDAVRVDGHRIELTPVDGHAIEISHLARNTDDFILRFRLARASARRAALLQWTGDAPLATFESHAGDDPITV